MNIQPSSQSLRVGQRYRLRRPVDRDPYFLAQPGLTGTLIHCDEHLIRLQMDEIITDEFDNCIEWYDYEPTSPILEVFYQDCQLLLDMPKLIQYVVEDPGMLTLTILLPNGETMAVPISLTIAETMVEDIYATLHFKDDPNNYVPVLKVTCRIDPETDTIISSEVKENRE